MIEPISSVTVNNKIFSNNETITIVEPPLSTETDSKNAKQMFHELPIDHGTEFDELSEEQQKNQNEKIKKAVEQLNKSMSNSEAIFGIHEGTNRVTIKIVDKSSKEVLKEVPAEKTLDMIAKVWEMAGILVDVKR